MKTLALGLIALTLIALPNAAPAKSAVPLGCTVSGSPFPYDLRIANNSAATLEAGTRLKWTVGSPHATGKATLTDALLPGATIVLTGALIVGPAVGTPCAAVAIV